MQWDVAEANGDKERMALLNPQAVLATLIRCIDNPLQWVRHSARGAIAPQQTETVFDL